jgi:vacuolar-type H+-ATPase subunit H
MRDKISKIRSVEDESYRIMEATKNEANALIEAAKQQSRKILDAATQEAQKEGRALIQAEDESVDREMKELLKQSIAEEDALKKSAADRIGKAKEYVINKLLEHYKS